MGAGPLLSVDMILGILPTIATSQPNPKGHLSIIVIAITLIRDTNRIPIKNSSPARDSQSNLPHSTGNLNLHPPVPIIEVMWAHRPYHPLWGRTPSPCPFRLKLSPKVSCPSLSLPHHYLCIGSGLS